MRADCWPSRWRVCSLRSSRLATRSRGPEPTPASDSLLSRPGAALRKARELAADGEVKQAEALLTGVADRHPLIADYAEWLRLRILVEDRRWREAADLGVWRHTESPLEADFARLLGDAHAGLGDEAGARGLWETARRASSDESQAAALLVAIARSYERSGDEATAHRFYLDVWARYPLAPVAREATERLAELEDDLDRPLRNAAQERRRGDIFFRANRNQDALVAYDRALASPSLSPEDRGRAQRQRAETLFRMRRYPEAAEAYAALPQDDEVRIARARCFARSGDVPGAVRELETIGRESRGEQAARASLLAGLLLDGEGEPDRAQQFFDAVVRTRGRRQLGRRGALAARLERLPRRPLRRSHGSLRAARGAHPGSDRRAAPALLARARGASRGARGSRHGARLDRAQLSPLVLRLARERAGGG